MSLLTLLLGVMLPWLAGYAWLRWFRPQAAASLAVPLGYGFFAGTVLLFVAVRATVHAGIAAPFLWVCIILGLLALAAYEPARRFLPATPRSSVLAEQGWAGMGMIKRLFAVLLLAWLSGHLAATALEIFVTPVFPWDAWTTWVYRAKAWFLAGPESEFVRLAAWSRADEPDVFAVPGAHYPLLPSVVYYWAALALGEWHEAWVNLPVWFCGLAIVLGFYGQCRAAGLAALPALAFAYLLVSTPLFGVHTSLGGYADIWMTGFAGLGFVALLHGLVENRREQILLGFLLLAAGLLVKQEAIVWLLAGVLLYAVVTVPRRVQWMTLAALLLGALILYLAGLTLLNLPYLGRVGVHNEILWLPFIGAYRLQVQDVLDAYLNNAFTLGTWHLAWLLVPIGGWLALVGGPGRRRQVIVAFLLIFAATQVAIFVFSTEGAWARDYTAINRLPLHAYPGLLFATALAVRPFLARAAGAPVGVGRLVAIMLLTVVVVGLGAVAWLHDQTRDQAVPTLDFGPQALTTIVGRATQQDGALLADGYQNGIVLLSSGSVSIDARRHDLLRLDLELDPDIAWPEEAPAFFWRRQEAETQVSRITLDGSGLVDLSISPEWRGEVTELGLLFIEHGGQPTRFRSMSLEGAGLVSSLELLPGQWFEFEPWSQRSGNYLFGGAPKPVLSLTLLVVVWSVIATLFSVAVFRHWPGARVVAVALTVMLGWTLLDFRWSADRARQAALSVQALTRQSVDERIGASELGKFYPTVKGLGEALQGSGPARMLLVLDPVEHKYYGLRSKYQLLPHSVDMRRRLRANTRLDNVDYVLFLGHFGAEFQGRPSRAELRQRVGRLPVNDALKPRLKLVSAGGAGLLFQVSR